MEGVAKLQGKLFALASETDSCRRFSEALIKKVTGGDTVTGSFLYGSSFEFRPEFKLWLLANHLPIAKDGSCGFWRRVKVIPFARRFNASGLDQNLRASLQSEEEGILAWCVRGAMNWIKMLDETNGSSGLGSCSAVENAVADYKDDHDTFRKFIEECLVESPGNEIPAAVLYTAYQEWCTNVGETNQCSQVIFASRLAERSIPRKRKKSGNVYTGYLLSKPVLAPQGYDDF